MAHTHVRGARARAPARRTRHGHAVGCVLTVYTGTFMYDDSIADLSVHVSPAGTALGSTSRDPGRRGPRAQLPHTTTRPGARGPRYTYHRDTTEIQPNFTLVGPCSLLRLSIAESPPSKWLSASPRRRQQARPVLGSLGGYGLDKGDLEHTLAGRPLLDGPIAVVVTHSAKQFTLHHSGTLN